jgi:ABC-2 type transport system permease protein
MILFPLTFISNVFVPPDTLPPWLEGFVNVNPITIVVSAVRGLMHGQPVTGDVVLVFAISAALMAVFGPLTLLVYRRKS